MASAKKVKVAAIDKKIVKLVELLKNARDTASHHRLRYESVALHNSPTIVGSSIAASVRERMYQKYHYQRWYNVEKTLAHRLNKLKRRRLKLHGKKEKKNLLSAKKKREVPLSAPNSYVMGTYASTGTVSFGS